MKNPQVDTGGSAFPDERDIGMSLRDYLAAKCMETFCAANNENRRWTVEEIAADSYAQADAMISARAK